MNTEQKVIEVVGGIIRRGDKYLLGRRPVGKSLGGHWEFIGGKIEPGEMPCEALARECREEIAPTRSCCRWCLNFQITN